MRGLAPLALACCMLGVLSQWAVLAEAQQPLGHFGANGTKCWIADSYNRKTCIKTTLAERCAARGDKAYPDKKTCCAKAFRTNEQLASGSGNSSCGPDLPIAPKACWLRDVDLPGRLCKASRTLCTAETDAQTWVSEEACCQPKTGAYAEGCSGPAYGPNIGKKGYTTGPYVPNPKAKVGVNGTEGEPVPAPKPKKGADMTGDAADLPPPVPKPKMGANMTGDATDLPPPAPKPKAAAAVPIPAVTPAATVTVTPPEGKVVVAP